MDDDDNYIDSLKVKPIDENNNIGEEIDIDTYKKFVYKK